MSSAVPAFVWFITIDAALALIAWLVAMVALYSHRHATGHAVLAGVLLAAWLIVVALLAGTGALSSVPGGPPRIAPALLVPLLAGAVVLSLWPAARSFVARVPQTWLIGAHTVRLAGLVFVAMQARGVLPGLFALPAGWGDFAIGVTAPLVAYALARQLRGARTIAVLWNLVGIADLVNAVTLGALSATSSIRTFATTPTTDAMARLPLSLIPTFAVPILLLLHVASLMALRQTASSRRRPQVILRPVADSR